MIFIKKISTIFIVLIIFISSSNSEEQIVYLDLDNVVTNTKAGKSILSKLEKSKKSAESLAEANKDYSNDDYYVGNKGGLLKRRTNKKK